MRTVAVAARLAAAALGLAGCGRPALREPAQRPPAGVAVAVTDSLVPGVLEVSGTAEPLRTATLSTKLMGTVTAVLVQEGDRVAAGQLLLRLDGRDLEARRAQVEAGLADAMAAREDAVTQAGRMRGLYADSAATRAQLDQAETGLVRAEAAVAAARGVAAELSATAAYAEVRAPFAGLVTRRFVDPGAFATPGAPLAAVEDAGTLRVAVSVAPEAVRGLRRGMAVRAGVGDTTVGAMIEGIVPAGSNLYTINALVPNPRGRLLSGSAATLALPRPARRIVLVPLAAIERQGDLAGVRTLSGGRATLRWLQLGPARGAMVEVLSGLAPGDTVLVAGKTR